MRVSDNVAQNTGSGIIYWTGGAGVIQFDSGSKGDNHCGFLKARKRK